ncbi:sorbosone dehydrogenase family protein [Cesiribacter sp. SM1]|uniref:PQQ-dependent sugar dehydrogenase n=1 Tax=Cesiribacter sp. SM1 TaxID=2861196 RepID=UPI001CD812BF|nr:sorbosone dehydrogenase family protein [Cesiribacter sp. SM1]
MKPLLYSGASLALLLGFSACTSLMNERVERASVEDSLATYGLQVTADTLPQPYKTESHTKRSETIGWPEGKTPQAPAGFTVAKFAEGLEHPRNIYVAPNGDIFVAESDDEKKSANRIAIIRDANNDGRPEMQTTFMSGLNQPYGMLVLDNYFYVANTDGVVRYPYQEGQTSISGSGEKILDLPAGGYNHHWTRNLLASPDGSKIYISIGSASNNGEYGMEEEVRRANVLEINPDGSGERVYAAGLRNPVGIDWKPGTQELWAAVNERDELGDNLVPDYITSVQEGGFYGWPYAYFGPQPDPRMKGQEPELVKKTIVPDVALGAHTSSLGLAFYDQQAFPQKYHNGVFVGQHGSWNRSELNGYRVLFIPFENGKPAGPPEDFLTGFIADLESGEVYGRPVDIEILADGSMLLSDDSSNTIWRVSSNR